jgi:hypothetical protein
MENDTNVEASAKSTPVKTKSDVKLRLYRWTVYALIVIALAILVWKSVNDYLTQSAHDEAMAALRVETETLLEARTSDLLMTSGMALEASVGLALRTGEYVELRGLLQKLKREAPVERIFAADASGTVRAASDPTIEGTEVEAGMQPLLKGLNRLTIDSIGEGRDRVLVPVYDGSRRIGVLVMIFQFTGRPVSQ